MPPGGSPGPGLSLAVSPLQRELVLSSGHTELVRVRHKFWGLQNKRLLGSMALLIPKGLPDALSALARVQQVWGISSPGLLITQLLVNLKIHYILYIVHWHFKMKCKY